MYSTLKKDILLIDFFCFFCYNVKLWGGIMNFSNKVSLEKKKKIRGILAIALLCCVACAAIVLGVYSIIQKTFLFVIVYLIAFLLSAVYTVMKINTVMPTFIANDDENLYMRYWENGFFPFRTDKGLIGEFIPEKVKNSKIMIMGISKISFGTGNYISRTLPDSEFSEIFAEYKKKYSGILKRTDFIHLTLINGKERYMSVSDFDIEKMAEIIKEIKDVNSELEIATSNRKIRRLVLTEERRGENND